ncbi:unnamed protein product, partial [Gulo gulo]
RGGSGAESPRVGPRSAPRTPARSRVAQRSRLSPKERAGRPRPPNLCKDDHDEESKLSNRQASRGVSCFPRSRLLTPTENVGGSNRPYCRRGRQLFIGGSRERGFALPHAQVSTQFPPGHGDGDSAPLCPRLSAPPPPPPGFGSPTKVARCAGQFSKCSSHQQHPPFRPPRRAFQLVHGLELFANSADTPVPMEMFSLALPLRLRVLAAHRAPALGVMEPCAGPGHLLIWIRKQGREVKYGENRAALFRPGEPGAFCVEQPRGGWVGGYRAFPCILHAEKQARGLQKQQGSARFSPEAH